MLFLRQLVRPLLAALILATTATAQNYGSVVAIGSSTSDSSSSATRTSSSTGIATHTIQVGHKSDPHQYSPNSITANVGDIVVFEFYPTNHSVVKADYLAPCVPASGDIFYSGMFNTFNEEGGQLVGDVSRMNQPYQQDLLLTDTDNKDRPQLGP
jgi:plastocyanin